MANVAETIFHCLKDPETNTSQCIDKMVSNMNLTSSEIFQDHSPLKFTSSPTNVPKSLRVLFHLINQILEKLMKNVSLLMQ